MKSPDVAQRAVSGDGKQIDVRSKQIIPLCVRALPAPCPRASP